MNHTLRTAGPTHIELKVEFTPARMSLKSGLALYKEQHMKEYGNPLFDVDEEQGSIIAVHQIEKIAYDHSVADDGELVWQCESCGAYSKTKRVVDEHEKVCEYKGRK